MNEYLLNHIYIEMKYKQTPYDELLRQNLKSYSLFSIQNHRPSLWDSTLYNTGNMLISLGEKLRRNRGCLRLYEDCR
ncbi:MAG: hypothetical protein JW908_02630 [Anaerolineales bacterium]|nr:hypothetical protein [Anaerolineales bacterium]